MLGLIYPAVLGSILYLCLDQITYQVSTIWNTWPSPMNWPYNPVLGDKFILLLITLAFYVFDYLYITFTNEYRFLFFIFDLIFVLALYFTVSCIDIQGGSKTLPNYKAILIYYALFMVLYLIWDLFERAAVMKRPSGGTGEEYKLYTAIVIWEVCSIVAIGFCFPSTSSFHYTPGQNQQILITLFVITTLFGLFAIWKKKFYSLEGYEEKAHLAQVHHE
jgi:hypothetical protein